MESFSNILMTQSTLSDTTYGVLLSKYLANLVSLIKKNMSQRNILNNKQPSVDP